MINDNNWGAMSPKGTEMDVHKLRRQEMMHNTTNYYDPEVPDFNKNKNSYYEQEQMKQPPFPWRRYFARTIDISIYALMIDAIAALCFKVNILETNLFEDVVSIIFTLILMVFVDSFLLSRLGTTPGKWIFGIKVRNKDGSFLSFTEALERTFGVLRYGLGFHIPIYSLYTQYKSYQNCRDGWGLDWEQDSFITLDDKKTWRILLFCLTHAVLILFNYGIYQLSLFPINRGDITALEFCENYNAYSKFFHLNSDILLPDGTWKDKQETDAYVVEVFESKKPIFHFTEENGMLKSIEFEVTKSNDDRNNPNLYTTYNREILLATISFLRAQERYNPFTDKSDQLLNQTLASLDTDSSWRAYDVDVQYDIDIVGYYATDSGYFEDEEKECSLRIHYKIEK